MPADSAKSYVLGVDGGGTKTDAVVAVVETDGSIRRLGAGQSGPSNLRLAGRELALRSLNTAVAQAMAQGGLEGHQVAFAVLALAGSGDPDVRREIAAWASGVGHFANFAITHDSEPVLAAGTPTGAGVALVVGTGSVATGKDHSGRSHTCGGWGHWFGDQGSGYYIGSRALAIASQVADGRRPEDTVLLQRLLAHFDIQRLRAVMQVLTAAPDVRQRVASVAPLVLQAAAEQDSAALRILASGADELAGIVQGVVRQLALEPGYPLALAGSVVCRNTLYRELLLERLAAAGCPPGRVQIVMEPVEGCLMIGRDRLANS